MKKIIKLTESDLQDIVSRVISEQSQNTTYGKCTNSNTINVPRISVNIEDSQSGEPRKVDFDFTTYFGATKSSETYKSTLLQLKKQILAKLKNKKAIGNYYLELMDVKTVVGSASNYLNGPLKPTNAQDGTKMTTQLDDEQYKGLPGKGDRKWDDNKGYADSRWKNLLNYIKNSGKNIGFGVSESLSNPENISSIITDTGGCTDEKRDISKFNNPGQYVRVIGTIKLLTKKSSETDTKKTKGLKECAQGLTIVVGYFSTPTEVNGSGIPKNSEHHECDYATFTVSCNDIPVGISNMNNGKYSFKPNGRKKYHIGLNQDNVERVGPKSRGRTVYSIITVGNEELEKIISNSKNGNVKMSIKGTPNSALRPKGKTPGGTVHGDAPMVWAYVKNNITGEKRTVYGPKEPFSGKGDVSPDTKLPIGDFNPCIEVKVTT